MIPWPCGQDWVCSIAKQRKYSYIESWDIFLVKKHQTGMGGQKNCDFQNWVPPPPKLSDVFQSRIKECEFFLPLFTWKGSLTIWFSEKTWESQVRGFWSVEAIVLKSILANTWNKYFVQFKGGLPRGWAFVEHFLFLPQNLECFSGWKWGLYEAVGYFKKICLQQ